MRLQNHKERIIIIDFGSQVTKLIARRVREFGVYSEVLTINQLRLIKDFSSIKGIILSGGPATVTKKSYPNIPLSLFSKNIPILGICYGLQLISKNLGGSVKTGKKKERVRKSNIKTK